MGSFPKAEQIVDDGAINRIVPASEPGALAPVRPGEAPNELWEWLRLLNRRKALIVGCGLVAVALMALIIAQATPMYKASARLLLDTRTFKVVSTEAALSGVDTMNLGAIQSELEVIQSEFLIGRVVDKLGLANNPDFNGTKPPGFIDSAFAPLRELWATGISTLLAPAPKPQPATAQPARTSRPAEESDPRRALGDRRRLRRPQRHAAGPHLRHPDHRREPGRHDVGAHRQCRRRGLPRRPDRHQERGQPPRHRVARAAPGRAAPQPAGRRGGRRLLPPRQGPGRQPRRGGVDPDAVRSQQQVRQRAHQAHRARGAPRRAEQGQPQSRRDRQHRRGGGQHHAWRRCASRTSS